MSDGFKVGIGLLAILSSWIYMAWVLLSMLLTIVKSTGRSAPRLNTAWTWLKWPAFTNIFISPVATVVFMGHLGFWDCALIVLNAVTWYYMKDSGDDDLGKKLKKKLTEIVASVNGKLVVVPA